MPEKRRKPSKTCLHRPFAPAIWAQAHAIASRYQVVVRFEDGEYYGRGLEESARDRGFRGVAEYVRALVLSGKEA